MAHSEDQEPSFYQNLLPGIKCSVPSSTPQLCTAPMMGVGWPPWENLLFVCFKNCSIQLCHFSHQAVKLLLLFMLQKHFECSLSRAFCAIWLFGFFSLFFSLSCNVLIEVLTEVIKIPAPHRTTQSVEKFHLPLSPDKRSKNWPVYLLLNMANVLVISSSFCSEIQTSKSWTNREETKHGCSLSASAQSWAPTLLIQLQIPIPKSIGLYRHKLQLVHKIRWIKPFLWFELHMELLKTEGLGWYCFDNLCCWAYVLWSAVLFLLQTVYIHISRFQFKIVFIIQQPEFNRKIAAAFPAVSWITKASSSFLPNSPVRLFQSLKGVIRILTDK